jgi:uncharacterized membrane-anchored protein YhcB (DUF1043 family)
MNKIMVIILCLAAIIGFMCGIALEKKIWKLQVLTNRQQIEIQQLKDELDSYE